VDIQTPDVSAKVYWLRPPAADTALKQVKDFAYRIKQVVPGSIVLPSLQLQIDPNPANPDPTVPHFTTLVYEPYLNGYSPQPTDGFRTYDADEAPQKWWSSKPIPGLETRDKTMTWAELAAKYPDARVLGYGWNQGSGNSGSRSVVQALRFAATTTCGVHTWQKPKPAPTPTTSPTPSSSPTSPSPTATTSTSPSGSATSSTPAPSSTPGTSSPSPSASSPATSLAPTLPHDPDDGALPTTGASLGGLILLGCGIVLAGGLLTWWFRKRKRRGINAPY